MMYDNIFKNMQKINVRPELSTWTIEDAFAHIDTHAQVAELV